ncbi:MAG: serine/threonine protein kinase [Planctomycetales bacterium]|nr:serine/threonine protein kinase [Planctomycetales bacterium]
MDVLAHLDSCEPCRRVLESCAADSQLWQSAAHLLRGNPRVHFLHESNGSPSRSCSPPAVSTSIQLVLDSLAPTDDPAMLGRLGNYEVHGVIGCGGMGVVLKATDPSLDRPVAIKVLSPQLAVSGLARHRFEREAKAAAAVLHPNVIAIHGVSVDGPLPYLAMPYLRAITLQKRIDSQGPLPLVDTLRIGIQIASGLAAAHEQGLVHRDIKPANILLESGTERATITDFGLARAVDDVSITQTGIIAGTPQFMSPEQVLGHGLDHRSDLFSLGSLLYAACTGEPPFRAQSTFAILRAISDVQPMNLRERNPELPRWLETLISRLMRKSPDERFQTAREVEHLLQQCLAHVTTPNAPLPEQLSRGTRIWSRVHRSLAVIALLTVVAYATILLLLATNVPPTDAATGNTPHVAESVKDTIRDSAATTADTIPWDDQSLSTEQMFNEATTLDLETRFPFEPLP